MRKSMFVSLAALILGASLALTGCKVGDDGGDDGGGDNAGNDEGDDEGGQPDAGGGGGEPCPPSVEDFETDVFDVALSVCTGCHSGGAGGFTMTADNMAGNLTAATNAAKKQLSGQPALLAKPSGAVSHAGNVSGPIHPEGSAGYTALETFIGQVTGEDCE
jgi:hypothetical protein